jgi:beta-lactamase class A
MLTAAGPHRRLVSRRVMIGGCLGISSCVSPVRGILYEPAPPPFIDMPSPFEQIEARIGGRVGVAALNLDTGRTMAHRADERFAMCSSFKWLLAAAALARLPHLQTLPIVGTDLIFHSPVTRARAGEGAISVMELAQATVETSDNAAANILLRALGGPEMQASATGLSRLRAGLPAGWRAGDKTGTSDEAHNATIDLAIAFPHARPPILIACFLSDSTVPLAERNAAHAEVGRIIAEAWS